jgi:Holliday junction resolvase-like predicted endonuclease
MMIDKIKQSHRGCAAELIAVNHLLSEGYEVFRNVSSHGPTDIVGWKIKTNEVHFFDVKYSEGFLRLDGVRTYFLPKSQSPNIKIIAVNETNVVGIFDGYTKVEVHPDGTITTAPAKPKVFK